MTNEMLEEGVMDSVFKRLFPVLHSASDRLETIVLKLTTYGASVMPTDILVILKNIRAAVFGPGRLVITIVVALLVSVVLYPFVSNEDKLVIKNLLNDFKNIAYGVIEIVRIALKGLPNKSKRIVRVLTIFASLLTRKDVVGAGTIVEKTSRALREFSFYLKDKSDLNIDFRQVSDSMDLKTKLNVGYLATSMLKDVYPFLNGLDDIIERLNIIKK